MFGRAMYLEILEKQHKDIWSALSAAFLFNDGVMAMQIARVINSPISEFLKLYL
jgi:hypothetical protein